MKKAQMEIALLKGLFMALLVVGGFFIYEKIQATTPSGDSIECKWDCSIAEWSPCVEGYKYRDISLCTVGESNCWESEPKPNATIKC